MNIVRSRPSPPRGSTRTRESTLTGVLLAGAVLLSGVLTAACGPQAGTDGQASRLDPATADSLLADLTGTVGSAMQTEQRWRLVASVGSGLPPEDYRRSELPEAGSHAVALLEAYCVQCHWIPSPQMHSAREWPILLRRMEMRSRTLENRMQGEMSERIMGEMMMAGMGHSIIPSDAEQDTILDYLQRNALPVVEPESLGDTEGAVLYVEICTRCHETPNPRAHSLEAWRSEVIPRMQSNMARLGLERMTPQEQRRIVEFLGEQLGS